MDLLGYHVVMRARSLNKVLDLSLLSLLHANTELSTGQEQA